MLYFFHNYKETKNERATEQKNYKCISQSSKVLFETLYTHKMYLERDLGLGLGLDPSLKWGPSPGLKNCGSTDHD